MRIGETKIRNSIECGGKKRDKEPNCQPNIESKENKENVNESLKDSEIRTQKNESSYSIRYSQVYESHNHPLLFFFLFQTMIDFDLRQIYK